MKGKVHQIFSKVRDIETLRRYGLDDEEIMELQDLRKQNNGKVEEYKDAYRDFKKDMRKHEEEGDPYLFKVNICGAELRVDQCLLFRMMTGTMILSMTLWVCYLVYTSTPSQI